MTQDGYIQIRIDKQTRERLDILAASSGQTMSEWLRSTINREFDEMTADVMSDPIKVYANPT